MSIVSLKKKNLLDRMEALQIEEDDLLEKFVLGSGSGGQKINKTSSCVYLKHLPTGIEIKCQQHRSREMNRFQAREDLCKRIETRMNLEEEAAVAAKEKNVVRIDAQAVRKKVRNIEAKRRLSDKKSKRKVNKQHDE